MFPRAEVSHLQPPLERVLRALENTYWVDSQDRSHTQVLGLQTFDSKAVGDLSFHDY